MNKSSSIWYSICWLEIGPGTASKRFKEFEASPDRAGPVRSRSCGNLDRRVQRESEEKERTNNLSICQDTHTGVLSNDKIVEQGI